MKLFRYPSLLIAWTIELFAFQRWFACRLFIENFSFTPQMLMTHLTNDTNADQGMSVTVVRILHNKVLALGWGLSQALLQYWDIRFLEEFIGVIGAIGVGLGVWYFVTKDRKSKLLWILFSLAIILPVVNAFLQPHIKYKYLLLVFGFIFQAISLYGVWRFLEEYTKKRYIGIFVIFIISILFLVLFPLFYQNFCIKI